LDCIGKIFDYLNHLFNNIKAKAILQGMAFFMRAKVREKGAGNSRLCYAGLQAFSYVPAFSFDSGLYFVLIGSCHDE
jgi:hypothetical protein